MTLPVYIAAGNGIDQATARLVEAREKGADALYEETWQYWKMFLAKGRPVATGNKTLDRLYKRSLIVFKLMSDERYGSLIAAPEFDEAFTRCGGYAYCWGRDAAYITTAIDRAGYHEMVRAFYQWTVRTQSADGSWQQRHYLDGCLAPSWGLQIDEAGSILWGMWQHYEMTGETSFLREVWPAVEKGARFLIDFIDPETGLPRPSRDLWEERDGEHTYSAAAVYGGLVGVFAIARALRHTTLADEWHRQADAIRAVVVDRLWNPARASYLRGVKLAVTHERYIEAKQAGLNVLEEWNPKGYPVYRVWEDPVIDASLLGLSVPFDLLPADDERMVQTAEAVAKHLSTSPAGGIKRYEDDHYIGGNPWILTTLWLAMYYVKQGEPERALPWFEWAVAHHTELGLLPEQIDRNTGETAWVVPLTWSHAMYVLALLDLIEAGAIASEAVSEPGY